jgi:flagellin
MRELMVQAGNDTLSSADRTAITNELGQLGTEVDNISSRTKFNGLSLLNGNLATSQNTATANSLLNTFSGSAGSGGNTNTISVSNINVSGAAADTFTLSASTTKLTLTNSAGTLAQTVDLSTAGYSSTAGSTLVVNFDKLGVSFSVNTGTKAGTGATASDVATLLANAANNKIDTTGGGASANFQVGSDASQRMAVSFAKMDGVALGIGAAGAGAVTAAASSSTATTYLTTLDTAIQRVSAQRGTLGASQNRLEHTIANLGVAQENTMSAESRIRDVDMAAEMVNFTKTGILQQAGQAILAQANQSGQGVLSLLRG